MRAVKSSGNASTEQKLIEILRRAKISGWRRHLALPGTPDLSFPKSKVAVMVHGCFWHGCKHHYRQPATNVEFWSAKVNRNMARDRRVSRALRAKGWSVLTFWEHDLRREQYVANRIQRMLNKREGAETR